MRDLTWGPNNDFMVYRVERGNDIWLEVVDVTGGSPYDAPIVITPTLVRGMLDLYRPLMSTAHQISDNGDVYFVYFPGLGVIARVDLSAIIQP